MGPSLLSGDNSLAQRAMRSPLVASIYERFWRPVLFWAGMGFDLEHYRGERTAAMTAVRVREGSQVLDLACGPGIFTGELAERVGPHGLAVGVDVSEPMLKRAGREQGRTGAEFVLASGHRLPFADDTFDAVLCYGALYLIPEPFDVVGEVVRVVRPGGRVALMASAASTRPRTGRNQRLLAALSGLRVFDRDEFTRRLAAEGFREITVEIHGVLQYVAATKGDRSRHQR